MRWFRRGPEVEVVTHTIEVEVDRPVVPVENYQLKYVTGCNFRAPSGCSDAEFLRSLAAYLEERADDPVLLGLWSIGGDGPYDDGYNYQVILEECNMRKVSK